MTLDNHAKPQRPSPQDMPYRCTSLVCLDGIERTDCVTVVDTRGPMGDEKRCGKPMVGVYPLLGGWMRMCEDCFTLFTHDLEQQLGVRL
jgi:hypothetical protein